jgi:hypothetical protein
MSDDIHVLAHVQKEIDKQRQGQIEFLIAERATSFEEYKKVCGVIRGLNLTDQIINDLVQRITHDD